jgi:ADYC domain
MVVAEVNAMRAHWLVSLIGLVGAVGCVGLEDVEEVSGLEQALEPTTPCPPWRCTNSAEVILYGIHELNLFGEPNEQRVTLQLDQFGRAMLFKNNTKYSLHISKGGFLEGHPYSLGLKISGQQLVGAELRLRYRGSPFYNIKINRVREITLPPDLGRPDPVQVYQFSWYTANGGKQAGKNICNSADALRQIKLDQYEQYGMLRDETLLFTGDRIDPQTMTMATDPTQSWINFGCANFTLAKLYMTRNTTESATTPLPVPERYQAMLKMYTGDYCGTGDPITVSGTPMIWDTKQVAFFNAPLELESRWNAHGATCLKKMRLEANPSQALLGPRAKLLESCSIPACEDIDPHSFGGGVQGAELVSAIPSP